MGLQDEFTEAVDSIRDLQFHATKPDHFAPFFETAIRYFGGTLSAYALSGDPTLLRHAERIGQVLLPAFNGSKSGLPYPSVNVETGEIPSRAQKGVLFAEAATCQLEFKYLAKLTGNREYYDKAEKAMDVFYRANVTDGLFHKEWSLEYGLPLGAQFTSGPPSDSGYEYLLKQWVQSDDPKARQQYIKSATGIINKLIYQTPTRGLLYAIDIIHGSPYHRFEHLTCYLPGVLALGASTLPDTELSPRDKEIHRWAAHGLAYTCAISFLDQKSGLGAEEMRMSGDGRRWMEVVDEWELQGGRQSGELPPGMGEPEPERDPKKRDYSTSYPNVWLLRPEGIESIFILWRTTGDIKWRERGYAIFQAIEKHARTEYGYASIQDIDQETVTQRDDMPSWFLAETLKYLYLLFDDTNSFALDRWVFSTEAHPLPIFSWTQKEREDFGIML
jgi:mannosyl-oligosaccharide alpha-1,2-mannosidase